MLPKGGLYRKPVKFRDAVIFGSIRAVYPAGPGGAEQTLSFVDKPPYSSKVKGEERLFVDSRPQR
jgi:hypothetical protein